MIHATVSIADALGCVLLQSLPLPGGMLKRGHVLTEADIARITAAAMTEVAILKLETGDLGEDDMARIVGAALAGTTLRPTAAHAGRIDLLAETGGLFTCDAGRLLALNRIDDSITVATLPDRSVVAAGDAVATIKIIPFAVSREVGEKWQSVEVDGTMHLHPFKDFRAVLVQTILPGTSPALLDKTARVTAARLAPYGGTISLERRVVHETETVAMALAETGSQGDILLVASATAIMDRADTVPAALQAAGGTIMRLGMPADPGNLIMLGALGSKVVMGLPGCARSPSVNGIDLVLRRFAAGLTVGTVDVAAMGQGGLLTGRIETVRSPRVTVIVLAAGLSSRMAPRNKLLLDRGGLPLIRRTVLAACGSDPHEVIVATGHMAPEIEAALEGLPVRTVYNRDYRDGMGASLAAAARHVSHDADAVLVCLGDMPDISPATFKALAAGFDPRTGHAICIPAFEGKRGHPVLFDRMFLGALGGLSGDLGARAILRTWEDKVAIVPVDDPGILLDIDTPSAANHS